MVVLGQLLYFLIDIYIWIIIGAVVISWLLTFEVISTKNKSIANLVQLIGKITDPVMRPVQKYIPSIGGIDISPIAVIFGLMIVQRIVVILFIGGGAYY